MDDTVSVVRLEPLGVISARGPDARRFLNGQLSRDVLRLGADRVELAGLHNPQGRTLALLRVVPLGEADVALVLPRERVPTVVTQLRRFVLRARLQITDESADWTLLGAWPAHGAETALAGLPEPGAEVGAAVSRGGRHAWRHSADGRLMLLVPAATGSARSVAADSEGGAAWAAADVAAGLPQVHESTAGAFVAQMLNLDVLGGISFDKGCYTGQEVIARAHYRGKVKRRLQRFATRSVAPAQLLPGSQWTTTDSRVLRVVEVARRPDGSAEFLAVAPWPGSSAAEVDAPAVETLACDDLPLPYALPD
jgi:folate-binding protein YgfZ